VSVLVASHRGGDAVSYHDVDVRIAAKFRSCKSLRLLDDAGTAEGHPAAPAAGDAAGHGGGSASPPIGNTGGKNPSNAAGVDWIRCVGPVELASQVGTRLSLEFGQPEPIPGRWRYDRGERYPEAVDLLWHDGTGIKPPSPDAWTVCVDISGGALGLLGGNVAIELLRWFLLDLGMHATRIDAAVDFIDEGRNVVECAERSCMDGELCGARVWEPKCKVRDGEVIARGINIGTRGGNGSGRYLRIYDKGLETQTRPPGEWERWEVEFTGKVGAEAGKRIAEADRPAEVIAAVALGAVEFRENNGRSELDRRPLAQWYADLIDGVRPERLALERQATTLESWAAWMIASVMPTVQDAARATGQSTADVLSDVSNNWRAVRGPYERKPEKRPIVQQYVRERLNALRTKAG
jgi:hypothetical protein